MAKIALGIGDVDKDYVEQLRYAMSFAATDILAYEVADEGNQLIVEIPDDADVAAIEAKVRRLIDRYAQREFGLKTNVIFEQHRDLVARDVWSEMIEQRLISPVGPGHVVLRGLAARLMRAINAKVDREFVPEFDAQPEFYPATIDCRTLDRCGHFTSFPEHVDFVGHLREDVEILGEFADRCRDGGWSPAHHEGAMAPVDFAISPSCCYHCYEGMEGWELELPGRCVTATLACHRYEGGNLRTMTRLRAFTMRELVWVGHPKYVLENRQRAEEMIVDWAKKWELDCTLENANDMFFTDDYAVKASFQRQQEAKHELRLTIPQEELSNSVFSSNFHSNTFGKAFSIKAGARPAVSGCLGWGYERWVYAIFSQMGMDPTKWPAGLREDMDHA